VPLNGGEKTGGGAEKKGQNGTKTGPNRNKSLGQKKKMTGKGKKKKKRDWGGGGEGCKVQLGGFKKEGEKTTKKCRGVEKGTTYGGAGNPLDKKKKKKRKTTKGKPREHKQNHLKRPRRGRKTKQRQHGG